MTTSAVDERLLTSHGRTSVHRDSERKLNNRNTTMGLAEDNIKDLRSVNLWKSVAAELVGTLFLVFFGCGTATNQQRNFLTFGNANSSVGVSLVPLPPSYVQISLSFGLVVATMVWCIAHVSGGHINPAVTVGCLIARKVTIVRGILYIVAQCAGAVAGSGILYGLTPMPGMDALGVNGLQGHVTAAQGFGIELMITFALVLTVMACTDDNREDLKGSAPLTIGLAVVLGHLLAIAYTGCSMNPARSFGPAVVKNKWNDHWVFWVGPVGGAVLASLLYMFVFAAPKSDSYDVKTDTENGAMQLRSTKTLD